MLSAKIDRTLGTRHRCLLGSSWTTLEHTPLGNEFGTCDYLTSYCANSQGSQKLVIKIQLEDHNRRDIMRFPRASVLMQVYVYI